MPFSNESLISAGVVGVFGILILRVLLSLMPEKKKKHEEGVMAKIRSYVYMIMSLVPGLILSQGMEGDLFQMITFQVGVLINVYLAATLASVCTISIFTRKYMKEHPEIENREAIDKYGRQLTGIMAGILIFWLFIAGIFGGGATGTGLALAGAVLGWAWTMAFASNDVDHEIMIGSWEEGLAKEKEREAQAEG